MSVPGAMDTCPWGIAWPGRAQPCGRPSRPRRRAGGSYRAGAGPLKLAPDLQEDPMPSPKTFTGGCQCGQVRYEIAGRPHAIFVCHCRECQKQSASAFGISVMVRSADVRLVSGRPQRWSRQTDTGRTLACFFCPACGTRVWHGDRESADEISVKGGSLDEPPDLRDAVHIWTARRLPGVIIPEGARQHPGEPA